MKKGVMRLKRWIIGFATAAAARFKLLEKDEPCYRKSMECDFCIERLYIKCYRKWQPDKVKVVLKRKSTRFESQAVAWEPGDRNPLEGYVELKTNFKPTVKFNVNRDNGEFINGQKWKIKVVSIKSPINKEKRVLASGTLIIAQNVKDLGVVPVEKLKINRKAVSDCDFKVVGKRQEPKIQNGTCEVNTTHYKENQDSRIKKDGFGWFSFQKLIKSPKDTDKQPSVMEWYQKKIERAEDEELNAYNVCCLLNLLFPGSICLDNLHNEDDSLNRRYLAKALEALDLPATWLLDNRRSSYDNDRSNEYTDILKQIRDMYQKRKQGRQNDALVLDPKHQSVSFTIQLKNFANLLQMSVINTMKSPCAINRQGLLSSLPVKLFVRNEKKALREAKKVDTGTPQDGVQVTNNEKEKEQKVNPIKSFFMNKPVIPQAFDARFDYIDELEDLLQRQYELELEEQKLNGRSDEIKWRMMSIMNAGRRSVQRDILRKWIEIVNKRNQNLHEQKQICARIEDIRLREQYESVSSRLANLCRYSDQSFSNREVEQILMDKLVDVVNKRNELVKQLDIENEHLAKQTEIERIVHKPSALNGKHKKCAVQ
ncbi:hypothetical protein ACOME3_003088 [Neoechinorhynchus agilis]